jgi:hypothetical protein
MRKMMQSQNEKIRDLRYWVNLLLALLLAPKCLLNFMSFSFSSI